MSQKPRCVNIDWLEVYCMESGDNFPHDMQYFQRMGYDVRDRGYGTRQYEEMFVILDKYGEPFVEIRRKPVSGALASKVKGIFSPFSCHLRLSNRWCYADNAVDLFADFLNAHGYAVQRIFRLDLCLDFEKFDDGTDPANFIKRYMKGVYTKINQGNISAHGVDRWEGREWNSLSWGAPKSMVSTKLYCKTLELKQAKDKPYIRFAWQCAGLVDDFTNLTKVGADGQMYTPVIWRLEFSIRSSARQYVIIDNNHTKHTKQETHEHALDTYDTKLKQLQAFMSLAHHYFYFKYYEEGKRKDLCRERITFKNSDEFKPYKLLRLLAERKPEQLDVILRNRINEYRMKSFDVNTIKACDILIKDLDFRIMRSVVPSYDLTEAKLLQQLISRRMQCKDEDIAHSIEVVKELLKLSDSIF